MISMSCLTGIGLWYGMVYGLISGTAKNFAVLKGIEFRIQCRATTRIWPYVEFCSFASAWYTSWAGGGMGILANGKLTKM